jgi:hypothetical protein
VTNPGFARSVALDCKGIAGCQIAAVHDRLERVDLGQTDPIAGRPARNGAIGQLD